MSGTIAGPLIAVGLLASLAFALESGFRLGRWHTRLRDAPPSGQVGAIQGALLGLLGLLLGFSFAAAGARFLERQDLIVKEANAIGTAYLRADLVDEPQRTALRSTLRDYTQHRVNVANRLVEGASPGDVARVADAHARMWAAARDGVRPRPEAAVLVVSAVNDVIDHHSLRVAAAMKHLPMLVVVLLIACSLLAVADIGYGNGLSGARRLQLTWPLVLVIALALWITIDLDYPRAGLLRLNDAPLVGLTFPDDKR